MANKTVLSAKDPMAFIQSIGDEEKKEDSLALVKLIKETTHWEPKLWGKDMVGFGKYHYHYASGREGEFFIIGFSPKKRQFSFYTTLYLDNYEALVESIGAKDHGKACLHFKNLESIDEEALKKLIHKSIEELKKNETCEIIG